MKSMKILGQVVPVTYHDELESPDNGYTVGLWRGLLNEVQIKNGLPNDVELEAIVHEFYEGATDKLGIDVDHQLLSSFAYLAFLLIKDNWKSIKKYLEE